MVFVLNYGDWTPNCIMELHFSKAYHCSSIVWKFAQRSCRPLTKRFQAVIINFSATIHQKGQQRMDDNHWRHQAISRLPAALFGPEMVFMRNVLTLRQPKSWFRQWPFLCKTSPSQPHTHIKGTSLPHPGGGGVGGFWSTVVYVVRDHSDQ